MLTEIPRIKAQIGDVAYNFGKRKHVKIKNVTILDDVLNQPNTYSRAVFRRVKNSAKSA